MHTPSIRYRIVSLTVCVSILFGLFPVRASASISPTHTDANEAALSLSPNNEPDVLSNPVTISRLQTVYIAGITEIEFTITNNLPPTRQPEIPAGATVTDTMDILASFVITDDVNTLRVVTVEDTLTDGTTLLAASGDPAVVGGTLTWALPDLPPQGTSVITMSVQTPPAGGDFVELDSGARVEVEQWGDPASAAARPAVTIPGGIDPAFTQPTVDADSTDVDMLWKSAEFVQDPLAAFEYVRGLGFDPYKGSLRGTRGTLWGQAGNSADKSSLLIAMLRAAGAPARYRHGALSTPRAQTLIGAMFPPPVGVAGYIPDGTPVSDPVNDPALIALVSDHWWVEAYLPGLGWTDLDPSFPDAQPGDVFATPGANDRIAELPEDQRHEIIVRLKVEQYTAFPISGSYLQTFYPLEVTFPTAQLASKRLTFSHLLRSEGLGGVYTAITHTYTPYFEIDDNGGSYLGDSFQDMYSSFPLSSQFTTAEWLEYEITDPNGNVETFTRTVKDLVGADKRLSGGSLDFSGGTDSLPFTNPYDLYVNWVLPNDVPAWVYERRAMSVLPQLVTLGHYGVELLQIQSQAPSGGPYSPQDKNTITQARGEAFFANEDLLSGIGLDFGWEADRAKAQIESGLQTKLFYATPRVFTISSVGAPTGVVTETVDLRRTTTSNIVYPGQAVSAAYSANWAKGVVESVLEGQVLEAVYDIPTLTAARVFDEMELQGITPVWITPADAYLLDVYPFSTKAKAFVMTALFEGKNVLIPTAPVSVDGQDVFGWWQVDPQTGETISVMENGLHTSFFESSAFEDLLIFILEQISDVEPGPAAVWEFINVVGANLTRYFGGLQAGWSSGRGGMRSLDSLTSAEATWRYFPAYLCPVDNCGVEQFLMDGITPAPIPLPETLFVYSEPYRAHPMALATLPVTASQPAGDPAFTLAVNPEASSTAPGTAVNFQAEISSNFDDDFTVMAYAPEDWNVRLDPTGSVTAQPPAGAQPGDYTLQIVAQSSQCPSLFGIAQHTVTITALDAVSVDLEVEPNITTPMGEAQIPAVSNQTNDGETEINGAAYTVEIANPGQFAHTYDVTVSGPPAGWVILNGEQASAASVTLPAGTTARLGLYIQPPADALPTPGVSYPVNVGAVASDNPALTDGDSATFTMPEQPFNYLTIQPADIYLSSSSSADFTIQMTNVGNDSGSFPIFATLLPVTGTIVNLESPVSLAIGETHVQTATLETAGLPLGSCFPLVLGSPAPGSYTQYALANVQIVSENSEPVFRASDRAGRSCTVGEPGLSAALEALALAMVHLEASCQAGGCDLSLRDQAVDAANTVALYASRASTLVNEDDTVVAVAAELAAHTSTADILADLAVLSDAVAALDGEICALSRHLPELRWRPFYGAALQYETITYTLDLTNRGTVTTIYSLTVEALGTVNSEQLSVSSEQVSVSPGATVSFVYPMTVADLGLYDLDAMAVVVGDESIYAHAAASLNVVDRYVQLTAVIPDPAYVETGVSSTTLSIEVANVANVTQDAVAHTVIQSPTGAVSYTAELPLTVLIGAPRLYELQTVDTSGWAAGIYTVTVELLDTDGALIPNGSGYGYFGVGQGLVASHAVSPAIVPPGTFTVTTVITTEILDTGEQLSVYSDQLSVISDQYSAADQPPDNLFTQSPDYLIIPSPDYPITQSLDYLTINGVFTRTEQSEPEVAYTGTWSSVNTNRASGGSFTLADAPGETAALTFEGVWVNVGFLAGPYSGRAEVFIDGVSQGTLDLYRREDTAVSFVYGGLITATHTISVAALGTKNPYAFYNYVQLDYFDAWDGSALPDGSFEQDDARVIVSPGWWVASDSQASGGTYINSAAGTIWFPFSGDSFSFHTMQLSDNGWARLYVDGEYLTTLSLHSFTPVAHTYSYQGFGAGPHILQVAAYRGNASVDAFTTPGLPPFDDPQPTGSFTRYEEDDPLLRYNGVPYTQTITTWGAANYPVHGSGGYFAVSGAAGDSVSLTFEGVSLGVGFLTYGYGGQADIYLDGDWLRTVDLFTNNEDTASFYFDGLAEATHTVTVTILSTAHPNSLGHAVRFDYFDVWDGTALPEGTFEESSDRLIYSGGWYAWSSSVASGGGGASDDGADNGAVWFPFTGESVTYQALAYYGAHEVIVKIDGVPQGIVDIYSSADITKTISFDGLPTGVHVLEVRAYRRDTTLDAFITPGVVPWYEPPAPPTGVIRYEEDNPALLYNGYPLTQTVTSWWPYQYALSVASNGWTAGTSVPGNWVALDFSGTWVGVGFAAYNGEAEIFIDGVSRGILDLDLISPITNVYFDDLITGAHTISVTSVSGTVLFDFFDTWDGSEMDSGWYEAHLNDHRGPYHYNTLSHWYTQVPDLNLPRIQYAREGDVIGRRFPPGYATQLWFTFTGDDLMLLAFQASGTSVEVFIDGISQGAFDLTPEYSTQPYALHFQDLGDGPHVASVSNFGGAFLDAFQVNPPNALPYTPQVEWTDDAPTEPHSGYANDGLLSSAALGDLDGDGLVEIVAPASNGQMYVYRGDGQDAGSGSPLIWQTGLVGSAAEPAIADLDGDGYAEIIVVGSDGTAAFHHDGSIYWFTDTIKSGYSEGGYMGWGGPSIGNVDLDPEPEIVLAAYNDGLYVLDHDGTQLFYTPTGIFPTVPALADLTGDGVLDILYAQDRTISLLDHFDGDIIEWTRTHTYTGYALGTFGAPAVADVDGGQPGGDDGPEVIINWGPYVDVLDEDGALLWNYNLGYDYFRPSPVTIADVDGDGEIEILTASAHHAGLGVDFHTLFVLNANATLLWQQTMGDATASASGVATQDLNGDGVWEVLWNGQNEGFTIMNGPDGEKLFNEGITESGTMVDYPVLGDVDGDGFAEVVTGGYNGIFVIGHDGIWGDSRPLWNQHNYHITNVNDDLSIPANEPNSWDLHNTYRTQTPERNPMPSYAVTISHTVGVDGVAVLTTTFNISPDVQAAPLYGWSYTVDGAAPVVTRTFESVLTGLQPGEARLVAERTVVAYRLPGGWNWLTLPPLYVSVPHIIAIQPDWQAAGAGATVIYTVTLTNPGTTASDYTLELIGLPDEWGALPPTVNVPPLGAVSVPLTVTLPVGAGAAEYPFGVSVTTSQGGADQANATLESLGPAVEVSLDPADRAIPTGETAVYTLTVTNLEDTARTYALAAEGLAPVNLPAQISVAANSAEAITVTVRAVSEGSNPFTVIAAELETGASAQATAAITGQGFAGVAVVISPSVAQSGPGVPTVFAVTVTNLGSAPETYDLSVEPPVGWDLSLTQFGQPVSAVMVAPGEANAVETQLTLTPPADAALGDYNFTVTATDQQIGKSANQQSGVGSGVVQIGGRGVQVEIVSGDAELSPTEIGTWQVQVTNTGNENDTYDLSVFGPLAAFAEIAPGVITLAPGQSQTVQVTAGPLIHALPGDLTLGVLAESQSQSYIRDEDTTAVTITEYQAVEAAWLPDAQTVTGTLSAFFTLIVTNTGNVNTTYLFAVSSDPAVETQLAVVSLPIPPHSAIPLLVKVTAPEPGTYLLTGTAESGDIQASDTATLIVINDEPPEYKLYLPLVLKLGP